MNGGFGQVYRANWIDGYIYKWNNKNQDWDQYSNITVALKVLNNSKNVTWEFINEITLHHKIGDNPDFSYCTTQLYGITQDPEIKNYIMDLEYAEHGSLRNYLDKSYDKLSWEDKLNVLQWDLQVGRDYTKAADVYSFGIIMYELISGLPPYHDVSYDENANPLKRQTADEIANILCSWYIEFNSQMELKEQIKESEEINNKILGDSSISPTSSRCSPLSNKTHLGAIYTSRLINFNNLPEAKNSDDYYNLYDDIISKEYSASLQIDISKLKINDDGSISAGEIKYNCPKY
ncbi:kinase-like domain-containing protein [Rhizophagus diaphanus]|nr:kinase-like domain-containing protein [Rhizophagus diaphanus] [Rhizophagus sp. MUCL 43196]